VWGGQLRNRVVAVLGPTDVTLHPSKWLKMHMGGSSDPTRLTSKTSSRDRALGGDEGGTQHHRFAARSLSIPREDTDMFRLPKVRRTSFLRALVAVAMLSATGIASKAEDSAPPLAMKQANVNGVSLVYEQQGKGPPVLFIHGCCADFRAWDAQRQPVSEHHNFIGLNLRYHGTAPWPDDGEKYSHQQHADDIAAFITGLNVGPVDLVGWSYSGLIVMLVVAQHPELVHSLTIHEPATVSFVTDPANVKTASDDRVAMMGPAIAAAKAGDLTQASRLVPVGVNHQADFWDSASPAMASMFSDNARTIKLAFLKAPPPPPMTCDQLRQFKVPTLITYGSDTRLFYRIAAEAAAECIPGAKLVVIEGGRHLAVTQKAEAFNAALLEFLAKNGS
jgi:pimeloyl-ACP methyl ester carboxylesterase